ncbi:hypothetical protein Tco_1078849 [Tanacetum coccineum]|uniref:CCHC-type domain-containing protein n=1 Tax=Tanacetum coccineum TaxID=301880 RepID=A0ABQ5HR34_9ASTR
MQKAKALMFIRHHLHVDLKIEYLNVKDPLVLWDKLKDRFDHQKTVILPKARYEWTYLRLHDFKSVSEYNSAMHRITSMLLLCGDTITDAEMLEKLFPHSMLLIYYYSNNIEPKTRPTCSAPLPEANKATYNDYSGGRGHGYYRGRGYGRDRRFGRGNYYGINHDVQFKNTSSHKKWQDKEKNENDGDEKEKGVTANSCYRCRSFVHWAKHCRTPKHLAVLYQKYIKNRENRVESNFVYDDRDNILDDHKDQTDATHLDDDEFITNE